MSDKMELIHEGSRIQILTVIGEQASELHKKEIPKVICPCGVRGPINRMYQCFYCDIHFCPNCAKDHFGENNE